MSRNKSRPTSRFTTRPSRKVHYVRYTYYNRSKSIVRNYSNGSRSYNNGRGSFWFKSAR